jgi:hypothetical protein
VDSSRPSRLDELYAARKAAWAVLVAASDAASAARSCHQRGAPEVEEAEKRVTAARTAYERAGDAWVLETLRDGSADPPRRPRATAGPQLDLLLGAGGGR